MRALTKATQTQVAWLRDPEVVKFSEQRHREHTLSSQLRYINSFGEGYLWGIYTVHDGAHIGNMSASIDQPNKTADVGILIGETRYWRKGYGLEAWREACRWMLDPGQGALRKLEAGCMATNLGMRRILDKSGFKLEGERLNHFLLNGSPVGMVFYGRFK
jgi:RimJ/RimL family protein N-acetyltransferase